MTWTIYAAGYRPKLEWLGEIAESGYEASMASPWERLEAQHRKGMER